LRLACFHELSAQRSDPGGVTQPGPFHEKQAGRSYFYYIDFKAFLALWTLTFRFTFFLALAFLAFFTAMGFISL
jgi:hypothetical protein